MKEIHLKYDDWNEMLWGESGFLPKEDRLFSLIKELASRDDVILTLTLEDKPHFILEYDDSRNQFTKFTLEN